MGSTLVATKAKTEEKRSKANAPPEFDYEPPPLQHSIGAPAGLPRFVKGGTARRDGSGSIQRNRTSSIAPVQFKCTKCQEEDERARGVGPISGLLVQTKCACCGGGLCEHDHESARAGHNTAREGIADASSPLPHLDRIQASFGRHDISGTRAAIGGPAARANESMGSLAYTMGGRIAFRAAPDLRLAAHEATHVVQQRAGVQLKDGVGRPGDGHEQQADAVADAVDRGESADPLLDPPETAGAAAGRSETIGSESQTAPLQHLLTINARRLFEPPAAPSAARGVGRARAPAPAPGPAPVPSRGGESKAADAAAAKTADQADPNAPPKADAGAPLAPDAGGGGTPAQAGKKEPPCTGPGDMHCYHEPTQDPADDSAQEEPPEPESTKSKGEASGDTEPLPEPDICPAQKALAAQPAPQGAVAPGALAQSATAPAGAPRARGLQAAPHEASPAATAERRVKPAAGAAGGGGAAASRNGQPVTAVSSVGPAAAIAGAEMQRSSAVAAYTAASAALSGAQDGTRALRTDTRFAPTPEANSAEVARAAQVGHRVDAFFAGAADRLDATIAFASQQLPDRLGAQAEAGKARLAATIDTQKSAISARIGQARDRALADAAMARAQVLTQADAFAADAKAQTAAAIETLRAGHATALEQVNGLETATLDRVNQIYADGRIAHEGLGVKVGDECVTRGEEFASFYLKDKKSGGCWTAEKDSFFKGYLTQRRAEAQAHAARETATNFRKSLIDAAKKRAREVVKAGRKADRCAVIVAANQARDTLDQQLVGITAALESARDSTLDQASHTRHTLLDSIDKNLAAMLNQLDQQEHDQRQAADDTGYMQQLTQEQLAHSTAAALQRSVVDAVGTAQSALASVQAHFAANTAPDLAILDGALALVARRIDGAVANLQAGLESGTGAAEEQLAATAMQGTASLEAVAQSSNQLASAIQDGFGSAMSTIAGSDNFAALRTGFTQQVQQTAVGGSKALGKAVSGLRQACEATKTGATTSLGKSETDLEKTLHQNKQGMECAIPKHADEAASREAPAWKRVLAVVLVIVVIIIMVVVTVVTFGAGGIVAGIVVGAIVGAATSAMLTMASNLWNNQDVMKGVARAALEGAITGALGGGLGAWMGGAMEAAQVTSKVAIFAANIGLAAGLDVATQLAKGGWRNFSFSELGITALVAAVSFGAGAKFGGKVRVSVGRGPRGRLGIQVTKATVGAAPTAGIHPTEAPAPAVHPTEIPTPSARLTETPTPAAPLTETPTAAAHPAEMPAAVPRPAEPTPTAAPRGEPPAPGARAGEPTTAAPETPTIEARPAPKPADETVLENTAIKKSEDLTPAEATAERDAALRTEGEPVNDPPFTRKHDLPNGHEVLETEDGTAFKRCSNGCVVFDGEGNPIASAERPAEAGPTPAAEEEPVPEGSTVAEGETEEVAPASDPEKVGRDAFGYDNDKPSGTGAEHKTDAQIDRMSEKRMEAYYRNRIDHPPEDVNPDAVRYERHRARSRRGNREPDKPAEWDSERIAFQERSEAARVEENKTLDELGIQNNNRARDASGTRRDIHEFSTMVPREKVAPGKAAKQKLVPTRPDGVSDSHYVDVKKIEPTTERQVIDDTQQMRAERMGGKRGKGPDGEPREHAVIIVSDKGENVLPQATPSRGLARTDSEIYYRDQKSEEWFKWDKTLAGGKGGWAGPVDKSVVKAELGGT